MIALQPVGEIVARGLRDVEPAPIGEFEETEDREAQRKADPQGLIDILRAER